MTIDSDTLLMLAGKGSRDAMGELYRRHKPQVVSFFRHMRASSEQAEDLAQEVFLRIWKAAAGYCPAGKYSSFMFTVAANVWRDQRRRSSLRRIWTYAMAARIPIMRGRYLLVEATRGRNTFTRV